MPEALDHEAQHRLMPVRIEIDEARRSVELEGAHRAVRRHETQRSVDGAAEPIDAQVDGELRTVRPDRIFEQHIQQLLAPVEIEIVGERRPQRVGASLRERGKESRAEGTRPAELREGPRDGSTERYHIYGWS